MLSTTDLLDLAREHQGNVTDYRISKLAELSPTNISNYRTGRSRPETTAAIRLAELAGIDPAEAVFSMHMSRAATDVEREFWAEQLRRLQN